MHFGSFAVERLVLSSLLETGSRPDRRGSCYLVWCLLFSFLLLVDRSQQLSTDLTLCQESNQKCHRSYPEWRGLIWPCASGGAFMCQDKMRGVHGNTSERDDLRRMCCSENMCSTWSVTAGVHVHVTRPGRIKRDSEQNVWLCPELNKSSGWKVWSSILRPSLRLFSQYFQKKLTENLNF